MNRRYGWVIVAAGAVLTCVAMGAMFSLAVFLDPITAGTGWSRTGVSSAMTLNFLIMGIGGFTWGAISDRFGARVVVLIGAVVLGLALVLASRATSLAQFQLTYGILVGIAASAFFTPVIATTTGWFDTHRSLAVSLVSAGMGVAPMTISPFARWLISTYDWRSAMLIIGVVAWVLLIPAASLIRRPPMSTIENSPSDAPPRATQTVTQALRSPQFIVLGLTFFACCAAHSGPIFHMVSYATHCGLAPMAAVSVYSLEGLAGLGGRIFFGVMADRLGVKRVLVTGLFVQASVIAAYLLVRELGEFYALAIIFGTAYGGVMPLYAVLAREYFGQRIMGTVFGAATMLSSIGMSIGPIAGGWAFDHFGDYAWMFTASSMIGVGAAALAIGFPPVRRHVPLVQPAT